MNGVYDLIRKALKEFAKVANVKDDVHSNYIHAAGNLIMHEIAKGNKRCSALTKSNQIL